MPRYTRGMPSPLYWRERSQEVVDERWKETGRLERRVAQEYERVMRQLVKDMERFVREYGIENRVSEKEARATLSRPERIEVQQRIARLAKRAKDSGLPEFHQRELSRLYTKLLYDRLSGLFAVMEAEVIRLTGSIQTEIAAHLAGVYTAQHAETFALLKQGTGAAAGFVSVPQRFVESAITMPWSGAQFSDRLWLNKQKLVKNLQDIIVEGVASGQSVQKMSRELKTRMGQTTFNSKRIIQTETAHVVTQGTKRGYEDAGVTQYEFMATTDDRTSKACGSLDGKVFDVSDLLAGTNAPPMHPHCRSAIAPHFP